MKKFFPALYKHGSIFEDRPYVQLQELAEMQGERPRAMWEAYLQSQKLSGV